MPNYLTLTQPIVSRRRIALWLAGLGLLALALGAALAPSTTSATSATSAPASVAAVQADLSLPVEQTSTGLGCWVTGDMVWSPEGGTDGNPADMTRALCGGR